MSVQQAAVHFCAHPIELTREPPAQHIEMCAELGRSESQSAEKKKYEFMLSDIFLRFLLTSVLRPRQKPSPKERAGAGVNRTPLLQVTTRGVVDLDSERARGALPAGPAASEGGTAHKELLKAVRIVRGG